MPKIESWVEKYRPKYLSEIKGQEEVVKKVRDFIKREFLKKFRTRETDEKKNAVVLYGPPGTGKTAIAHATANEINAEIFELNASDLRNREMLKEILKPVTEQASLLRRGKIILVDEIDGISKEDEEGLSELNIIIKNSSHPIIITANDIWDKKFSELRKIVELIQLKELDYPIIKSILVDILKKEKKFIDPDILTDIAIKCRGDVRAAINDLQTAASLPNPSDVIFDERNKELDVFTVLKIILKSKPNNTTLKLFDSINKPLDEILLWIEENIPVEYKGKELARAYDILSKVDIFRKRIHRQQYWRFLVYQSILLSYGIASSKYNEKIGFTSYKKPNRILKMWMNNQRIEKKKSISKKYAKYVHVGEKRALKEFPTIKHFLLKPEIQKELKLTEEEIMYLESN